MRHIKRTHDLSEWINKKLCCMTDFEKVIDFNNMYRAFRKAKCGKGYKNSSAKFNLSALDGVHGLIDQLKNKTYRVSRYVEFKVYDPKERVIQTTSFKDKVIQHSLCGKTQIFPFKNGVSYLGFHTYINVAGCPVRKLKNQNKRNAQRKFVRMAKLVRDGKLPMQKFQASYAAWKNHAMHGSCRPLIWNMDQKINAILKKEDTY